MIDVIGTDAGAPHSLPAVHLQRLRAAALIAAPTRLLNALDLEADILLTGLAPQQTVIGATRS